eukprot:scaffold283018_cov15-Tisochrysis_lutea.AAC.1
MAWHGAIEWHGTSTLRAGPAEVADCDMLAQGLPQQMAYAAAHSGAGGGSSEEASNSGGEARAQ